MSHADGCRRCLGEPRAAAVRLASAASVGLVLLSVAAEALAQPPGELRPPPPNPDVGPSAQSFLVAAYAVIWLVTFGFVLLTVRRQGRLEQRIAELTAELDALERAGEAAAPATGGRPTELES